MKCYHGKLFLGKELNQNFTNEIFSLPDIDPCAENGEYHSFVYNGPIFSSLVSFCARYSRRAKCLPNQIGVPSRESPLLF